MKKFAQIFLILFVAMSFYQITYAFDYTSFFQNFGLDGIIRKINFGGSFVFKPVTEVVSIKESNFVGSNNNTNLDETKNHSDETNIKPNESNVTDANTFSEKIAKILGVLTGNKTTADTPKIAAITDAEQRRLEEIRLDRTGLVQANSDHGNVASPASGGNIPAEQNFTSQHAVEDYYKNNSYVANDNPAIWNGNPKTKPTQSQTGENVPIDMNTATFVGIKGASADIINSLLDGRFQILQDGWLQTKATNFGLGVDGSQDVNLVNYSSGCPTSMSGFSKGGVKVCNKSTCVLGIPPDVMDYYFGKTTWNNSRWAPYPAGPNAQSVVSLYRKVAGTPIEVVNTGNGKCTVVPLWETGPSKNECAGKGCGLDLTYCVKVVLLDSDRGRTPVKYRPVPAGKRGCEDYNYIPAPVNTLPAKK